MDCGRCGSPLDRPGDYCLVCRTSNADAVVVDIRDDRAELAMLDGETVVGRTTVTTTPETGDDEHQVVQRRNFAGRVADEVRRKRPEAVFVAGDHDLIRAVRADLRFDVYRVDGEDPVASVLERRGESPLEVVDKPAREKLGGSHSTVIGGRTGEATVRTVASHPHVKKIIPGPIEAGGSASSRSAYAKVTRADQHGNVRLLIRDGSSVQENRVVTTAGDRETGERVREALNRALREEGLQ